MRVVARSSLDKNLFNNLTSYWASWLKSIPHWLSFLIAIGKSFTNLLNINHKVFHDFHRWCWEKGIGGWILLPPNFGKRSRHKTMHNGIIFYFATIQHPLTILVFQHENKTFLLELKEPVIMRDKPSLNRNTISAPLHLFGRP